MLRRADQRLCPLRPEESLPDDPVESGRAARDSELVQPTIKRGVPPQAVAHAERVQLSRDSPVPRHLRQDHREAIDQHFHAVFIDVDTVRLNEAPWADGHMRPLTERYRLL